MKVFVAHFTAECNEHISHIVTKDDFHFLYDEDCIDAMHIKDIFENAQIEIIPSIFASMHPNGMIQKETFDFICKQILASLKSCVQEIDGIYLQFHGASGVKQLSCISGEHYLLHEIRKITGKYMPIAMVMDPHGNLTNELCDELNIVRCYRESPHSDQVETERLVAKLLIDLLKNRRSMKPIIRKLPIMVGGERSVSAKEPVCSINRLLDEAEKGSRVFSTSFHVGYIRHDDDKLGAAVVVVPNRYEDKEHCEKIAEEISNYVWNHREEFQFSGNFDELDKSVEKAISYPEKTVVITDSGDNCGAGGAGQNTVVLEEFLKHTTEKKVLIAGINDEKAHNYCLMHNVNDRIEFDLGIGENELSKPIHIVGTIIKKGIQLYGFGNNYSVGDAHTIRIEGTNIDVIVLNHNIQYGTMEQFHAAGLEFHDYDIVVVKMGYLDTYLIPETKYHIMALTDGPTIQRSEKIPFKKIYRPMWPIDDLEKLEYIL